VKFTNEMVKSINIKKKSENNGPSSSKKNV
jgi:hypothetical protein